LNSSTEHKNVITTKSTVKYS